MKLKPFILITLIFMMFATAAAAKTENGSYVAILKSQKQTLLLETKNNEYTIPEYTLLCEDELQTALEKGEVEYYEPNNTVWLFSADNGYGLDMVAPYIPQKLDFDGNGVKIGIIDSGIASISELKNKTAPGYNFISGNLNTLDSYGHGTFAASIIASDSYGVAPGAKLIPFKAFDSGEADLYTVLTALKKAVESYNCDIINLSLGTKESTLLKNAIDTAEAKGIIVVAAAGNIMKNDDGTYDNDIIYPAAYDNVIGVGSVNSLKTVSSFSRHNSGTDFTAPGENVLGFTIYDVPDYKSGTSFAAPYVTGIAAIAKQIKPSLTVSEFYEILKLTSEDLGESGYDEYYGHGLVNAERVFKYLTKNTGIKCSDVKVSGEKYHISVFNTGDKLENLIFSYKISDEEGKIISLGFNKGMTLEENRLYTFESPYLTGNFKFMIWDNNYAPINDAVEN